jgi:acetoacetyl-CoA synthetase
MAPLWTHPSPPLTRLDAFRRHINKQYNEQIRDYASLHRWTVENLDLFYRELWNFSGLVTSKPPLVVVNSLAAMWPRPQWFPGAEMNFTENVLATGLAAHQDMIAVSACREGGTDWRHLTWIQLRDQVAVYASALQNAGVGKGDRVASKDPFTSLCCSSPLQLYARPAASRR